MSSSILDVITHYQKSIEKSSHDEARLLHCIEKLYKLPVTVEHLQTTGVGKTVNSLRKYNSEVGIAAKSLVAKWKAMVAAEENAVETDDDENRKSSYYDEDRENGNGNHDNDGNLINGSINQHTSSSSSSNKVSTSHSSSSNNKSHHRSHSSNRSEGQDYVKKRKLDIDNVSNSSSSKKEHHKKHKKECELNASSKSYHNNTDSIERLKDEKKSDKYKENQNFSKVIKQEKLDPIEYENDDDNDDEDDQMEYDDGEGLIIDIKTEKSDSEDDSDNIMETKKHHDNIVKREPSNDKNVHIKKEKNDSKDKTDQDHYHNSKHHDSSKKSKHDKKETKSSSSHYHKSKDDESRHKHKQKEKDKRRERSKERKERRDESKEGERRNKNKERKGTSEGSEEGRNKSKSSNKSSSSNSQHRQGDRNKKKSTNSSGSSSNDESKEKNKRKTLDEFDSKASNSPRKSKTKNALDGGIDSSMGTSFEEALGILSAPSSSSTSSLVSSSTSKSSSKSKSRFAGSSSSANTSPTDDSFIKPSSSNRTPSTKSKLNTPELLTSTAKLAPLDPSIALELPTISPNYKPMPLNPTVMDCVFNNKQQQQQQQQPQRRMLSDEEALAAGISSKTIRTKVYSGVKTGQCHQVPSLFDLCIWVLQKNIDCIEYTGGVPYDILKQVLEIASPIQLLNLEEYNPYLMEETDCLWEKICKRHCKGVKRQEMETWREMYLRCQEEREERLSKLTENIKQSQKQITLPIKKTQLAYVDSMVKPPRNVLRKQEQFGTSHRKVTTPAARVASLSGLAPNIAKAPENKVRINPNDRDTAQASAHIRPKKAPLMQKTLQLMKGRLFKR